MKRILLSILMVAACLCDAMAQNNAMFVYRNDGQINAFLKADVDSIRYSHIGLDSLYHGEYVVQEVWTPDSIYRIPLAAIDSVSFVTPPTVYKTDVTKLDGTLLDYVVGCDSLTLRLKADTPAGIVPKAGDKLVLLDGCEALPYGFSGIVSEVRTESDGIDVVCEQAYLEDLFDSFCSVSTMYGSEDTDVRYVASSGRPDRVVYNPNDMNFKLGPFSFDANGEISQGITPDGDLALKGGADVHVSIQPTFRVHTFLVMGEGQGMYFNCSITGDINVESSLSLYSGVEYSKDVDLDFLKLDIPIAATANLVHFYFVPGFFGRMGATVTASVSDSRTYAFGMAYDYSSIGGNVVKPSLGCRLASQSTEIEGCIDGNLAAGAFVETGFKLLSREIARVCVRGEYGTQINGNFVLRNSDVDAATKETTLYERLKASSIGVGPYVNASMQASVLTSGVSVTLGDKSSTLIKKDIVPTFSNTELTRSLIISTTVDATADMSGDCLFPVPVGFKLFDENKNEVADYNAPVKYTNEERELYHSFTDMDKNKSYTVYPKVKLFGFDILASPSAKLDYEVHSCPDGNHPHAIDLGLPSGTKWCCRNVGASSPEDYGGYYAWGETSEKSYFDLDNYAFYDKAADGYINIGDEISGTQYDVAHVVMGGSWRMPTDEQRRELTSSCCTWEWTQLNGVNGQLVTGPNGGQIFLPAAGYWWKDNLAKAGSDGCYWSGSLYPYFDEDAYSLYFRSDFLGWCWKQRALGISVRAVCP